MNSHRGITLTAYFLALFLVLLLQFSHEVNGRSRTTLAAGQSVESSEVNVPTADELGIGAQDISWFYATVITGGSAFLLTFILLLRQSRMKRNLKLRTTALSESTTKLEKAENDLVMVGKERDHLKQTLEDTHTNLRSAQSQLVHAEKMSSLGQLTAGIAHEINNPVNFIKGGVQTLKMAVQDLYLEIENYQSIDETEANGLQERLATQRKETDDAMVEIREMVDQLFKDVLFGTERVTEIVKGLRVFSRHDEAQIKSSNLHENLDAAIMILKHKSKNKAEIIKQYDANVQNIDCFAGQLNQVFVNLISNAVDAMDNVGTLIISTHDIGDKVQLSFKDNGKGIPAEVREKIFDPFFSTKDVGEGTGLGLAISHSIIDQHKGKIEVFSEIGSGTEFRITLPKMLDIDNETEEPKSPGDESRMVA